MLSSVLNFLTDEERVDDAIYWVGYVCFGWLLKLLAWVASKTKTTLDDEVVKKAQEEVKKSGERKKKKK